MPVFQMGHQQSSVSDDMDYGTSMMLKSSSMTFFRGAKQIVVQEALLTNLRMLSYLMVQRTVLSLGAPKICGHWKGKDNDPFDFTLQVGSRLSDCTTCSVLASFYLIWRSSSGRQRWSSHCWQVSGSKLCLSHWSCHVLNHNVIQ